jgi:hypothetical protein
MVLTIHATTDGRNAAGDEMSDDVKLDTCPFCGAVANVSTILPGGKKMYGCFECGIRAHSPEDWNRRAKPAVGPATRDALKVIEYKLRSNMDLVAANGTVFVPVEIDDPKAFLAELEADA